MFADLITEVIRGFGQTYAKDPLQLGEPGVIE